MKSFERNSIKKIISSKKFQEILRGIRISESTMENLANLSELY